MQYLPLAISALALLVSGITLWLTHLRRGSLKMTQPTVIFFGPDGGHGGISKVFLRTLLYSTGKRGHVLEHLFLRLKRGETQQNFSIWVYGEKDLARGSGLFIGQEGVATNHHFLTPSDIDGFAFVSGSYRLEVYGKIVGQGGLKKLTEIELHIDQQEAEKLKLPQQGIYFDWGPDAGTYIKKIDSKPEKPIDPLKFLEALQGAKALSKQEE
jgi:hypothetical protein